MPEKATHVPTYAELLARTDAPPGSAWGLFGEGDELGTVNFLTPERVAAAARCVRRGVAFNLDCPLDAFDPPVFGHRKRLRHRIFGNSPHHRDDHIDDFYLQSGTQIDGLRHFRHPVHGFYNRMPDAEVAEGTPALGVNRYCERPVAGRGVLVDVERFLSRRGERLDYRSGQAIPVDLVDAAAAAQGVDFRPGDILMLRTGWMKFYFDELSAEERTAFPRNMACPGLKQGHDTLAWIWNHQFSVCASDNYGVECHPPRRDTDFANELAEVPDILPAHRGLMHPYLIALFGLMLGEQWSLDALAEDCAKDGVWDCFVTVKPLNLKGGVGSPANAMAIK